MSADNQKKKKTTLIPHEKALKAQKCTLCYSNYRYLQTSITEKKKEDKYIYFFCYAVKCTISSLLRLYKTVFTT